MTLTPSTMMALGTRAPEFSLPDTEGNTVSLSDFKKSPALLVVFMCNHCPYVIHVAEELARLSRALRAALPPGHLAFLQKLALCHRAGGYFFVHAGIRPGRPLEEQAPEDLLWIRQPFLRAWRRHEAVIVHGHCARETPQVRHNRIGIDTGAYLTDRLACLVLRGSEQAFLFAEGA